MAPHSPPCSTPMSLLACLVLAATTVPAAAGVALGPMVGMSATSYSISASTPGRLGATSTSLNFSSSSNLSYDPTTISGVLTGDSIDGGNWYLQAVGADFAGVLSLPTPYNFVGVEIQTSSAPSPNFALGDTISSTFELVFTGTQTFQGLGGSAVNVTTATLARAGGSTTNLTTATVGTTFAAGTYTLTLSGTANSNSHAAVSLVAAFQTTAIPGGGVAVVAGLFGGLNGRRRRRG